MADKKISALTAASTPLAGTEVLPIVQSGATVKVAVSDLTAGRAISATSITASTGNFVVGTSGQGVDFSATPGTGTSELLADYEEGTWTPAGNGITFTTATGKYTKVGNLVTVTFYVAFPTTADSGLAKITGLPYVSSVYAGVALQGATIATAFVNNPTSEIQFVNNANTAYSTNANLSTQGFFGCVSYQV